MNKSLCSLPEQHPECSVGKSLVAAARASQTETPCKESGMKWDIGALLEPQVPLLLPGAFAFAQCSWNQSVRVPDLQPQIRSEALFCGKPQWVTEILRKPQS